YESLAIELAKNPRGPG
ncbi:hypothetical protein, partial [Candidatus Pseudothioglobus singularis]